MQDSAEASLPAATAASCAAPPALAGPGEQYAFCGFVLDPVERAVTRGGHRVPLTARLFDTLLFLVEQRGRLVGRDELLAAIWAGRHVEEGTAGRAVSSLRAMLREYGAPDTIITTAPNRGYRLSAPVTVSVAQGAGANGAGVQGAGVQEAGVQEAGVQDAGAAGEAARRPLAWRGAAAALAVCMGVALLVWAAPAWRHTLAVPGPIAGLVTGSTPGSIAGPPAHSVAVLPFENPGGDAADGNFADGLAEEIVTALGRVDHLRVLSARSSFVFRGHAAALDEIARRLNVGTVLDGTVLHIGALMQVTAHLTDAATGYQIWANTYDRSASDLLAVQADIVRHVALALNLTPAADPAPDSSARGSTNAQAWDAFFAGVASMSKGSQADRADALKSFSQAIGLDVKFERAYELRANLEWQIATGPESLNLAAQDALLTQAVRDGETAVALAPAAGSAHGALGWALLGLGRDLRRAGSEFATATRLAPGDGAILAQSAIVLLDLGQTGPAVEQARRSVDLDPLSADALLGAAWIYARAHREDDYRAVWRHIEELPGNDQELMIKDRCLGALVLQDFTEAIALCKAAPTLFSPYGLAIADWKTGHPADAQAALRVLQAMLGDDGAFQYAEIYAVWGDREASAHWLTVATRLKDGQLADILADGFLAPVRDTPEFDAAARSVNLR